MIESHKAMPNRATDYGYKRLALYAGTGALMLLPVLPERLSGAVQWDPGDFTFLAFLLFGIVAAGELAVRISDRRAYAAAAAVAIITGLLQMWINVAVGIIGSEDNPANLIYAAVLVVGIIGAAVARFRSAEMAQAMVVTAFAQIVAFVVAMTAGLGFTGPITIFFVALWLIAAWLFRRAASEIAFPVSPVKG